MWLADLHKTSSVIGCSRSKDSSVCCHPIGPGTITAAYVAHTKETLRLPEFTPVS